MKFDFSNLDVQKDTVAEMTLYQIESHPVLTLSPAAQANKPYLNALLKRNKHMARALKAGAVDATTLDQNRDEDRELYAKYIIKGWKNVLDTDGKGVPFSQSAADQFLKALPDWLFDEIRTFAGDVNNFVDLSSSESEDGHTKN